MKKKIWIIILAAVLLLAVLVICSDSDSPDEPDDGKETENQELPNDGEGNGGQQITFTEGLEYEAINNGQAYAVYGIGNARDNAIFIPNTYNGKPVTHIAEYAFEGNQNISAVWFSDNIISIGNKAFYGCTNLSEIRIPVGIQNVGEFVFEGCNLTYAAAPSTVLSRLKTDNLEKLDIIGGSYIDNVNTFINSKKLTEITIADSISEIRVNAFIGAKAIKSDRGVFYIDNWAYGGDVSAVNVKIKDGIVGIANGGFGPCNSLETVVLPDGLKYIGEKAFKECHSLISITIPSSVVSIGREALYGCWRLEAINYDGTMAQWNAIERGNAWDYDASYSTDAETYVIHCVDGDIKVETHK